jgi:hypothetical protein
VSKPAFKVPLVSIVGGSPPIDVRPPFIAAHAKFSQKQEAQKAGPKPVVVIAPPIVNVGNKKAQPPQVAALTVQPTKVEPKASQLSYEKDPVIVDYENMSFPDIQNAVDFILSNLASLDVLLNLNKVNDAPLLITGKEDAKTITQKAEAAKLAAAAKQLEQKKPENGEDEEHQEYKLALETEEKILRGRIERIRVKAVEHLKEFRNKAYQVYICLDEWVTQRFLAETQAVKDLVNVVRETIEAEQKLPNKLMLVGEKLQIDFSRLLIEPEVEQRAKSPIQPQSFWL